MEQTKCLIIGSGPAGSAAALTLAKAKKRVALFENRFFDLYQQKYHLFLLLNRRYFYDLVITRMLLTHKLHHNHHERGNIDLYILAQRIK